MNKLTAKGYSYTIIGQGHLMGKPSQKLNCKKKRGRGVRPLRIPHISSHQNRKNKVEKENGS
jgi:hypothetical protein